jgi:hypothetical protein
MEELIVQFNRLMLESGNMQFRSSELKNMIDELSNLSIEFGGSNDIEIKQVTDNLNALTLGDPAKYKLMEILGQVIRIMLVKPRCGTGVLDFAIPRYIY